MILKLSDLVSNEFIKVGDAIQFTFKDHLFLAKIVRGGLIAECRMYKPQASEAEQILTHVTAFTSLTSYTEACLQDVLDEYYTRYSSWKRVIHVQSEQTLGDIRDRCKLLSTASKPDIKELFKEIYRTHTIMKQMEKELKKLGCKRKWKIQPLEKKTKKRVRKKRRTRKDKEAFVTIQKMLLSTA